jgi:hypothetical protein
VVESSRRQHRQTEEVAEEASSRRSREAVVESSRRQHRQTEEVAEEASSRRSREVAEEASSLERMGRSLQIPRR